MLDSSDVIRVSNSIGVVLNVNEIKQVIEDHSNECENDPTGTWDLVVENQIYTLVNDREKSIENK